MSSHWSSTVSAEGPDYSWYSTLLMGLGFSLGCIEHQTEQIAKITWLIPQPSGPGVANSVVSIQRPL